MRFNGRRETFPRMWAAAAICALLAALAAAPGNAQVMEQGVITEEGTQFVTEDPPAPAPPPPVETVPPPPEPPRPQARAEPEPPPPVEPPRYPTVVILLDTSDSMLNRVPGQAGTLLEEAQAALKQVVDGMQPETQIQFWVFNTNLTQLRVGGRKQGFVPVGAPGSPMRVRLHKAIETVRTAGGTNLYRAVVKALDLFGVRRDQAAYRSGERFPVLVVISDGEDWGKTRESLESVQEAKARYPLVTVNTIGFNVAKEAQWFEELCRIATRPSGCATAGDKQQLSVILESFYRPRD